MKSFEDLRIWQEARVFANQIYDLTENMRDFGFKDQIQRAAVSVMNNIAEGFDYGSDAMFINILILLKQVAAKLKVCYILQKIGSIVIQRKQKSFGKNLKVFLPEYVH